MKKIFMLLTLCLSLVIVVNVKADAYYTNNNGVGFSEEQYNFLSDFYFEGYQDYMTYDDYNSFMTSGIMNKEINIITKEETLPEGNNHGISPYSLTYETNAKKLKLSTACSGTTCNVAVTLNWKSVPSTKSYDLIGGYFSGTTRSGNASTVLYYGGSTVSPTETKSANNGYSATLKLPSTNSLMTINQSYNVAKQGRIYVSYQHAKNSVTLAQSRNFSFSNGGLGNVFAFANSVTSKYDGMGGITTTL